MDALWALRQLLLALGPRVQILLKPNLSTYNNHIRIDVVVFLHFDSANDVLTPFSILALSVCNGQLF